MHFTAMKQMYALSKDNSLYWLVIPLVYHGNMPSIKKNEKGL